MKAIAIILFSFGAIALLAACGSSGSSAPTATSRPQTTPAATRMPVTTTTPTGTAVSPTPKVTQTPEATGSPPPAVSTSLSQAVSREKDLSIFATAVSALGIDIDQIAAGAAGQQDAGHFTFFAPSNEAMNALDPAVRDSLLSDAGKLRQFIQHVTISGSVHASDFWKDIQETALDGTTLELKLASTKNQVIDASTQTSANVILRDITAGSGLVQVTDTALLPTVT